MTIIINSADKSTAILFLNNILSLLYEEGEVSLGEGNCVLFYTDGLVEAHDPKGKIFGFPRLRALVAQHGEKRLLGDLLLEELYSFLMLHSSVTRGAGGPSSEGFFPLSQTHNAAGDTQAGTDVAVGGPGSMVHRNREDQGLPSS
jgi:hypothetical protein